ncbi:hypothetical protein [Streptomyces boluensis]|uniref:Uncharacterized protein n=1 Tax=Streptomyces boluensis TaxID=1775135 RepID=A0A964XJT1_9ACTN|nr:hypothetical protein [Streptomyces boluensis]NBE50361.1 hypothetical protein [Streptomyces boluensis]
MGLNEQPRVDVRVDIGALVLDGFGPHLDAGRVMAPFRAELTRVVQERGLSSEACASDTLSRPPPLPRTNNPVRLGESLARAVHAGLTGDGGERL